MARTSFTRSLATTFAATVGTAVLTLVNVAVIAWALGAEGRGVVAYAVTIAGATTWVASLSVQEALANEVSRRPELRPTFASTAALLAVVLGWAGAAVMAMLVVAFPAIIGDLPRGLVALCLVTTPIGVHYHYLLLFTRSSGDHARANLATTMVPALSIVANATLAILGVLTAELAVVFWLSAMLAAVLYLAGHAGPFVRPDLQLVRPLVSFGLKTHANGVMALGNFRLDQWVIGAAVGTAELGVYSIGVSVAEAMFFLPAAVALVSRPQLVTAKDADFAHHAASTVRATLALTVVFGGVLFLLAPFAVSLVFGDEFEEAGAYVRLLLPGAAGVVLLKILGNSLVARGRPLMESLAILAGLVVTAAGLILLVPDHGATGAAITSSCAYLTSGIVVAVIFLRVTRVGARELIPSGAELRRAMDASLHIAGRLRAVRAGQR